ncbi:MAG: hypothetical protein U0694_10575 [Anaerolineae bacterium]
MTTSRIHMSHAYGQTPANVFSDFDWIHRHEKELLEQYGECSIIVYQEHVLGVGANYDEALASAEKNLSPDMGDVTPVHRRIFHRHPFLRIRPTSENR